MKLQPKPNDKVHRDVSPFHYMLHAINALVVTIVCVAFDVVIVKTFDNQAKPVRWQSQETQQFKPEKFALPGPTNKIELGFREDGSIVWRLAK